MFRKILFLSFVIIVFMGCSKVSSVFKGSPAKPSKFIKEYKSLKEMRQHAPFHSIWFKDKEKFDKTRSKFKTIYFKPLCTKFIAEKGWWSNLNTLDLEEYKEDLEGMAIYAREAFMDSFKLDKNKRFRVVAKPRKDSVIYEIAIVELVATKAHINAIAAVAGSFVPGGGLINSAGKGSIAIEVKVIDGENQEVIIVWADREVDQSSVFNFNDFSWYSHARKHIQDWANQLVILHNVTTKDYVEDSSGFTLNPF